MAESTLRPGAPATESATPSPPAAGASLRQRFAPTLDAARRCALGVREFLSGASGLHAYEQYLAHWRAHHPDQEPLGRDEFFRRELTARWEGIRRCC